MVDSKRHVDPPREAAINMKRLASLRNTLQEAEGHATPKGSFRESKRPHKFSSYVALMSNIIDSEPSTFEEAAEKQEWKDAMMEEYQSIMENDVWEVVRRPEGKSVVTSIWIYKIKHAVDDSIEKYKERFVARGFSHKEGEDYDETFAPLAKYTSIRSINCDCFRNGMEITPDGCQDCLLEWCNRGRSVHRAATRFCDPWERVPCL
jgi:hypothetical protein